MTIVCGADGCRDGWVVVWHATAEQRLWWEVRPTLTSLLEARPTAEVIGIDSPIGLLDKGAGYGPIIDNPEPNIALSASGEHLEAFKTTVRRLKDGIAAGGTA